MTEQDDGILRDKKGKPLVFDTLLDGWNDLLNALDEFTDIFFGKKKRSRKK